MKRRDQPEMTKRTTSKNSKRLIDNNQELKNLKTDSSDSLHTEDDDQVKIIKPDSHLTPNVKKDLHNIVLLMFLYLLQGKSLL